MEEQAILEHRQQQPPTRIDQSWMNFSIDSQRQTNNNQTKTDRVPRFNDKQNKQHTKIKGISKGAFILQLPKLPKQNTSRLDSLKSPCFNQSLNYKPILSQSYSSNGRVAMMQQSLLSPSKVYYLEKLGSLIAEGGQLEKSTSGMLKKAKKLDRVLNRKYSRLCCNSRSIVEGVQRYQFQEEKTKKYKEQVRSMWMRSDK